MVKHIFVFLLLVVITLQVHGWSGLESQTLHRSDGNTVDWHLDRRGQDGRQGVLVLAQGSGCSSPSQSPAIETATALAPEHAVVLLEKRGVAAGFEPDGDECPASFHDQHTLSGWASDLALVIASLRDAAWWNGELVLFGGSEGGAMVTLAAQQIPETDALIVLSSGLGMTMAETLLAVVPPEVAANLEHQFADIRANPDSSEVWSGHAYRWWHEVLDRNYIDDLLALEIPVILIQGKRDRSVPVRSAHLLKQAFEDAGQTNLEYLEHPELDHGMVDADGNAQLSRVIAEAAEWLEQVLGAEKDGANIAFAHAEPATPQEWFDQRDYAAIAAWLDGREASSPEARYWKSRLAQVEGQSELALELAEALVADNGNDARLHVLLAEALAARVDDAGTFGQLRMARRIRSSYETAIKLAPENMDAQYGLFLYYLAAPRVAGGGMDRAREQAEVIDRISAAYGAVVQAALLGRQGDSSGELEALEKALVLDPMLDGVRFRAGLVYAQHENWPGAMQHFQVLVQRIPLHMAAWYQLGRVAALSGHELDTGRQALNRYLEAEHRRGNPSKAAAHWRLGMIEQHAGQPEIARQHYQQALDLDPEFENARQALVELNQQENAS